MKAVFTTPAGCPDLPRRSRLRVRTGRCYELSGNAALAHPEWSLVHGEVDTITGDRIGHAWVERDGWVYDSVLDRAMPSRQFAAQFNAVEHDRWPGGPGVAGPMLKHRHWGPWRTQS